MEGYFEDWHIGDRYQTRQRVVTRTDIDLFTSLTGIQAPLFLDEEYARKAGFKTSLTPGLLIMPLAVGGLYQLGLLDNLIAWVSLDKVKFTAPVYSNDTLRSVIEVIRKRDTKKKDRGLITFRLTIEKGSGDVASQGELTFLFRRRQETSCSP
jgi:acyl dehydratase